MLPNLQALLEVESSLKQFNDFDALILVTRQKVEVSDQPADVKEVACALFELLKDNIFLARVMGNKLAAIGDGIVFAKTNQNPTVHVSLARAFLEHAASVAYHAEILEKCVDGFKAIKNLDQLKSAFSKNHKIFRQIYYGSTIDADKNFVHVNDMIKALEKKLPGIRQSYDNLCDFVHPNFGSNKLVSSGELGSGKLYASHELIKFEQDEADRIIEDCACAVRELQLRLAAGMVEINSRLNISLYPNVTISKVFSEKKTHVGKGKTKEDAIFFHNARTHTEAMKALYEYLAKRKLMRISAEIDAVEGDVMYERVITDRGMLWVKYKVQDL